MNFDIFKFPPPLFLSYYIVFILVDLMILLLKIVNNK